MESISPTETSIPTTTPLTPPTPVTLNSPGGLPSTWSCWNPSHPRHVWPTTPGSEFRIKDCELYCFYCFKDGIYKGKYFESARKLRKHVVEEHLEKGEFERVKLIWNGVHSHASPKKRREGKRACCLPSITLDPQIQLSQIPSMLWLGAEHHVHFRRLITAFFSSNTSSLNNAVASFLNLYGPRLWPDSPKRRLHLSRPEGPSLLAYIGSNLGPAHSIHGKMSAWKRRKFLIDHQGREPTLVEEIAECPLGMAVYRYVELLKETGKLNKPDGGEHEGCGVLLEKIVGPQERLGSGTDGNPNEEERESSPDVPLRRQSVKRLRSKGHEVRDSSPEVALAMVQKRRRMAVAGIEGESRPEISLREMSKDMPHRHSGTETASTTVRTETPTQREISDGMINATTSTRPLQIDIPNQSIPFIDKGPAQQLPLWDHFMSNINQEVNPNQYEAVNEGMLDGNPVAAGVQDASLPRMLPEMQTSFTPSDEISPGSIYLARPEPFVQPQLMPNGGFQGHYDLIGGHARFTHENTGPSSAPQADFSLVGSPGSALPRTVKQTPRLSPFAEPGLVLETNGTIRREISASRLPPLITQPVRPYWSNPCEPLSTDWQVRRDSAMQTAPFVAPSTAFRRPGFESNDSRRRGSEYMPSHRPLTTTRVCMPQVNHPDLEPPSVLNTLDHNRAPPGFSPSIDDQLRAARRARLEMYRRETGGMGGLPEVKLGQQ